MTNAFTGEHCVVVGVDGSESALPAVRWAAREALRRGTPLRIVHVCHLAPVRHPRQISPPPEYQAALLEQGRHWLTEATEAARHAAPDGVVTTDLRDGVPGDVLVAESKTAQLLVLGSRGLGGFASLLVGSVAVAVTAHAHCPVVVTHAGIADGVPPETGHILVGLDGSDLSDAAMTFADEAAAARGVSLVAVRTWFGIDVSATWAGLPSTIDWDLVQAEAERVRHTRRGMAGEVPERRDAAAGGAGPARTRAAGARGGRATGRRRVPRSWRVRRAGARLGQPETAAPRGVPVAVAWKEG
jgi:nucleotide-binding universal stress UspA family protein